MDQIALTLKWAKTWPDRDNDFSARDGDTLVGRIYIYDSQSDRNDWFWTMYGQVGKFVGSTNGHEATARLAAKRVEDAWEALKARAASASGSQ